VQLATSGWTGRLMVERANEDDHGLLLNAVAQLAPRRGARQSADGSYMVLCPAHGDKQPSLQVSVAKPGHKYRLAWHCHAGCSVPNVRDAAIAKGVDNAAFAARGRPQANGSGNGRRIIQIYPYCDENGDLIFETVRYSPKGFVQRRADGNGGHVYNLKGVQRVLYRLPEVLAAVKADRLIAIVEGEKDVDRLAREGIVATTSPMGAEKWRGEYTAALAGAKVAILPDNDDPGRRHAEQVASSLIGVAEEVKVVSLPELSEGGDPFDWLERGHSGDELETLIREAPDWVPSAARVATNGASKDVGRLSLVKVDPGEFRAFEWLESGMIPASALTLLAGLGGKGKSTLAAGYAARATRGRLKGKYEGETINVLWIGNEDGRNDVVGPRLQAAGADFERLRWVTLSSESVADELDVVTDIDALRQAIVSFDARMVVIDPVVEFLPGATDSHNDMSVRHALRPIRNLAGELGVAVLGLVHLNKGDTLDVAARITGSGAFRNVARSVLVVAEYPAEEGEEHFGWRVVFQNKSNAGPEDGRGRLYKIEGAEYVDGEGRPVLDAQGESATTGKVVWGAEVDLDPYSLPARETARSAPKLVEAVDMVQALLKDDLQPRSRLQEQAKLEGISWRTVERAAFDELDVVTEKYAPPEGGRAVSWWRLPDSAKADCAISCVSHLAESESTKTAGQEAAKADSATKPGTRAESAEGSCEQCGSTPTRLTIHGRLCPTCSARVIGDAPSETDNWDNGWPEP
jgi:putative DNA primase/helicase